MKKRKCGEAYNAEHIFDADEDNDDWEYLPTTVFSIQAVKVTREHLPRNHGYTESRKSAYTQACNSTDQYLYYTSKGKTNTGVHGIHPPHGIIEVHEECKICNVREHR